jgi:hypothetical protein
MISRRAMSRQGEAGSAFITYTMPQPDHQSWCRSPAGVLRSGMRPHFVLCLDAIGEGQRCRGLPLLDRRGPNRTRWGYSFRFRFPATGCQHQRACCCHQRQREDLSRRRSAATHPRSPSSSKYCREGQPFRRLRLPHFCRRDRLQTSVNLLGATGCNRGYRKARSRDSLMRDQAIT